MSRSLFHRRDVLRLGAVGFATSALPGWSVAAAARKPEPRPDGFGRAKSCIILFAWGGMSHLETFDLKPDAPAEYRGLFAPIATTVPGIRLGEHLPHLARQTHRLAVIRSAWHSSPAHGKGMSWNLTGRPPQQTEVPDNNEATGQDWPTFGSVLAKLRGAGPPPAMIPYQMWDNMTRQGGHDAGWLGRAYDPLVLKPGRGRPYGGLS